MYDPVTKGTDRDKIMYTAMAKAQVQLQAYMAEQRVAAKRSGQAPPSDAELLHQGKQKLREARNPNHRCHGAVCEGYCRTIDCPCRFCTHGEGGTVMM